MPITPQEFVNKWKPVTAREKQTYQQHFLDLCQLVGHATPIEYDPAGEVFAFEMGTTKTTGGQGWADVAKLGFFGWEYKGKNDDLVKAYNQLLQYRDSLQNPPLLVVSDINTIIIRTNYTNFKTQKISLTLDDLLKPESIRILKYVFFQPEELKPHETLQAVTEKAAIEFAGLAKNLRKYGEDPQQAAHFLIRILFCLFAQDTGLLPQGILSRIVEQTKSNSRDLSETLRELFSKMSKGGYFGADRIPYINGGLFEDNSVLQLDSEDVTTLQRIDKMDWAFIEPSIFGTLFERGLDPEKRSQLGAHYTSKDDILLIVEPVLMKPLREEWEGVKKRTQSLADERDMIRKNESESINKQIRADLQKFCEKIASIQILDPACGSGNFLYIALRQLLDLQKEVSNFCESVRAGRLDITVSPMQLHGIERNEYAHELAQLTIWIGYIQWRLDNGYGMPEEPILKTIQNIVNTDAILAYDEQGQPVEPKWAEADVIIGNPPFLGGNKIRAELGDKYVDTLFKLYEGRIPAFSDLVCYWFEKARAMIEEGKVKRAGLLATNSIRGGVNRKVLERIKDTGDIFWAQSDRNWVLDGASVRVSMVGFDNKREKEKLLDGKLTDNINPDLSKHSDITKANILNENLEIAFRGNQKGGPFEITNEQAEKMLKSSNPNGKPNTDVVKKWANGMDLTRENKNMWLIDFGIKMPIEQAAQYELPFEFLKEHVYPIRKDNNRKHYRENWWIHAEPRPGMRKAIESLERYIVTLHTSKHRIFLWLDNNTIPDHALVVFARDDDYFFGVLHSKIHEIWSLKLGTSLEDRPRYTPSTTFETFPFPYVPGKEKKNDPHVKAIAQAAKELVEQRDRWLNSADAIDEPEFSGKRTLTNLYNKRPTWLELSHKKLDDAVFAAYGWENTLSDEEILERLLALNLSQAK